MFAKHCCCVSAPNLSGNKHLTLIILKNTGLLYNENYYLHLHLSIAFILKRIHSGRHKYTDESEFREFDNRLSIGKWKEFWRRFWRVNERTAMMKTFFLVETFILLMVVRYHNWPIDISIRLTSLLNNVLKVAKVVHYKTQDYWWLDIRNFQDISMIQESVSGHKTYKSFPNIKETINII